MEASILMRSIKPYIKCTPLVFSMMFITPASSAQDFIEDFNDETFINTSLTTANLSTEEQAVYLAWSNLNNDSGSFADNGTPISSDIDPTVSGVLADVDGDGDLDLVAGNEARTNDLYLNNGSGGFDADTGTDIGDDIDRTLSAVLADVDGDGDLDLVAGNNGQNKLYLNNGSGDFEAGTGIGDDIDFTVSVVLADVDGDGDMDLVAGNNGQNKLYLNNGFGDFEAGTDIGDDIDFTLSVVLADVDGDGDLDLVAGNNGHNKLYLNNGSGDFEAGTDIGIDTDATFSIALGDVNGDGDLDLVAGNDMSQTNKLYLNNGSGVFEAGTNIGIDTDATFSIALGDVNCDGHLDLVAGNRDVTNKLYRNDASGVFDAGTDIGIDTDVTWSIALGDVDGDGHLDLVAGNAGQTNKLYLNNSSDEYTLYHSTGSISSKQVNGETTGIVAVTLKSTAVVDTETTRNTSIDYFVTNTGGNTWYKVIPDTKFSFPNSGTGDVRWRAELNSLSPCRTPELSEVRLTYFFDEDAPVITLTGNDSITLEVGESFTDPGATATDLVDGDLTDSIVATGIVDPNTVDTYTLTYTVSDAAGNEATATLTVNVEDTIAPVITSGTTAANLAENSGVGQTVYTITASDIGGVTSFGIGGDDFGFLGVDNSTGVVTLTANPDYETKSSYSFTVTASDTANNTSAETMVTFSITKKVRTSGGCTVATGHSTDSSLILILVALLLFRFRRRGALTVIS